ncbi:AP-5 complex subunit sigma-1-like [Actinia tenebrosa]|uniref:AP-5 complex subunit sigma-1-like n=1 Tax=Actinia tenebrosa TaxID=6105 RepID=A0A6P8HRF8_ACTTE|nr:AP-5 complex subunit sigma-1-like [Actinia tenebrosa]
MVYAFILHTLRPGPCRVLFSQVFVHEAQPEVEAIEDARERRKEQLLNVANRVQSEFSFRFVTSGSVQHVDTNGLATTDELLSQLESGIFRLADGNPFDSEKVVVWKGIANCGFTLICEKTENRVLAENVLTLLIRYLQDYCRVIFQPTEAILKVDKLSVILFQFLPNGQLLFMNHRFVRQLEKEFEHIMAMK